MASSLWCPPDRYIERCRFNPQRLRDAKLVAKNLLTIYAGLSATGARSTRMARVGSLRLGEFGCRHDDYLGHLPDLLLSRGCAGLPEGVATQRFAIATLIAMVGLAVVAPILGAVADKAAVKKKLLGIFLCIGATATASMFFIHTGDWLPVLAMFVVVEFSLGRYVRLL